MVLYRSSELFITDRRFVVRRNPRVWYAITELRNVHLVCEEIRHAGQAVARHVGAWAFVLIVAALLLDSPAVLAVALLILGAAAAIGTLCSRRRTWELRARHRDDDVCLFASSDEMRFGRCAGPSCGRWRRTSSHDGSIILLFSRLQADWQV